VSLAEYQLEALNVLAGEVLPGNAFYARKLAGVVPPFASIEDFRERVPFTTKEELAHDQEENPPFGTFHTHEESRYPRFHQTSGTRGRPLIWMDDVAGWSWVLDGWEWVWREAGAVPGDRAFFPFSFGPFLGFWGAFEAAARMGVQAVPGGGMSSEERLLLLERCRANVLCTTPTYALRLAEVGEAAGVPVSKLGIERIVVCGEPGGSIPAVRERIEAAWRAIVFDHHGMTEIGPVTVSDAQRPGLLKVLHRAYLAEVVEPGGEAAVEAGGTGELVLTTLGRAGSPLLRYRTGDLVKPVEEAGEEGFSLNGGIIGRVDDMVVVRGVNLYPSAIEAVVRECGLRGEYRVTVDRRPALPEIRIEAEADAEMAAAMQAFLREVLTLRIPVTAVEKGSLPVFEVKAKRWVVLE
jgi:phenylacetate-CoA ligase